MAEENAGKPNGTPPKIKLNGNGGVPPPKPVDAAPPKMGSRIERSKENTARIDLSAAQMPPPGGPAGARPRVPQDVKSSTAKMGLGGDVQEVPDEDLEELAKRATIRIETPLETEGLTEEEKEEATKRATVRIDTSIDMRPIEEEDREEGIKKSTVQIEPITDMRPMAAEDREEAAKKSTVRVQIDEDRAKGDTTRLEPVSSDPPDAAKKRTARIDLKEVLSDDEQDIFKRRTALIDASKYAGATDAPGAPRTIRLKRPEAPPTSQLPAQPSAEGQVPTSISQAESARKSETARIDLPPEVAEQPPTRRKTIRIKRPGSGSATSSKPLVITRTGTAVMSPEERAKPVQRAEDADSPLFAWIAVAALLVAVVLVYVLGSQVGTIQNLDPSRWPFPGRM